MKSTPLTTDPEQVRAWQQRSRQKQIEAQRQGNRAARSGRIKARRKSARERDAYIARVYGSRERLLAIKALPCAVPDCEKRPSENHHISNGGTGRKADWTEIVPLCSDHHDIYHNECGSPEAFDERFGTDLRALAADLAERIPAEGRAA